MNELSPLQVQLITEGVRKEEIVFSHLCDDLIDHVCCDVEYEMNQGLPFEAAYRKVQQKIGFRGLKRIQEDTLFLVDSKYRTMRTMMKIAGTVGTLMLGFAALFKIMHWPGAGVLLTLGAFVLAFLFMPSAIIVLYKETKSGKRLFLFVSAFLAGFFLIISVLFKVQHWPGAGVLLSLSFLTGGIMFIPALLIYKLRDEGKKYKRPAYVTGMISLLVFLTGIWFKVMHWPGAAILVLSGILLLVLVAFPLFSWLTWGKKKVNSSGYLYGVLALSFFILTSALITLNVSRDYSGNFLSIQDRQEILQQYLLKAGEKNLSLDRDTAAVRNLHAQALQLVNEVQSLKIDLVRKAEGPDNILVIQGTKINYRNIKEHQAQEIVTAMLSKEAPLRLELEKNIGTFRTLAIGMAGPETPASKILTSLLDPSAFLPREGVTYEVFSDGVLDRLSMLQNAVLISESVVIRQRVVLPAGQ